MACSLGSSLNCETVHSATQTLAVSQINDNSQQGAEVRNAAGNTADPVVETEQKNGQSEKCCHGNEPGSLSSCRVPDQNILSERGRTSSSSSSDIDADREVHRHRSRHRRSKTDKQHKSPTADVDGSSSSTDSGRVSCQDCQTDLTDSDVEMCQSCFGLRKQNICDKVMTSEYCPFPFNFFKKTVLPQWLTEPEYVNFHPKDKSHRDKATKKDLSEHRPLDDHIHRNTDSLLSTASNFTNYRGLLNLCLLLLVLSNARLCMENLIKYGVLINPLYIAHNCLENLTTWPNAKILMYQGIHPAVSLVVQIFLAKGTVPEWFGWAVTFISAAIQLTYPAWVVVTEHPNPVFSSFTLSVVTVLFLKLISYAHVNYWCRVSRSQAKRSRRQSSSGDNNGELTERSDDAVSPHTQPIVRYPDNLNIRDISYFILAPTLCYELNFPRSARIRKRFFLKRLAEFIFLLTVIIGLVQQWIVPTIRNSLKPLSDMDVMKCCERLLKLAIPNHFIWLLFFYAFFHSMLNVLAELLKFGDRDFYQDWWNSETVSDFWKNWNIPVHRWAVRHVFKPLRKRGYSSSGCAMVVFIISAFFHEYLVSIPLNMFKFWAFGGMIMQIPLAKLTGKFFKGTSGNVIMWLSLIVGQPVAILAYVHDYYLTTLLPHTNHTHVPSPMHSEL